MKNVLLKFFKKYWLCMLLSIIMVIGIALADHYSYLYVRGDDFDLIRPNLETDYMVLGLPLFSLVIGVISYIKAKNAWLPPLIVGIISFIYWSAFHTETLSGLGICIWIAYSMVHTLIGTAITAFIYELIRAIKRDAAFKKQKEERKG